MEEEEDGWKRRMGGFIWEEILDEDKRRDGERDDQKEEGEEEAWLGRAGQTAVGARGRPRRWRRSMTGRITTLTTLT